MSFGFQHYTSKAFTSWQIMFLVVGLITIGAGLIVIAFMPDNPMSARRLTHAERVAAVERLRENQTGVENKVSVLASRECTRINAFCSNSKPIKSGSASQIRRPGSSHSSRQQLRYRMAQ